MSVTDIETVFQAARRWRDTCLLADGSVFSDKQLWTLENAELLDRFYSQNLQVAGGSFLERLEEQFASAPPAAKQLAAEVFWVLYLYPQERAMKGGTKRLQIRRIWEWSGEPLPDATEALAALEHGLGHPGTAYNTHRWRELLFFIELIGDWKRLSAHEQRDLVADGWAFGAWIDAHESAKNRQLRHMLLYMLFPDHYNRVVTGYQKKQIAISFSAQEHLPPIDYSVPLAVDRRLLHVREHLHEEYPDKKIEFYEEPFRSVWATKAPPHEQPDPIVEDDLASWYESKFGSHRVWAIAPGDGARLWPEFRERHCVAIGWNDVGDLSEYDSKAAILKAIVDHYGGVNPTNNALACYQFAHEMKPGDFVIAKKGRTQLLGYGVITSDYHFEPNGFDYEHVRGVEWKLTGSWSIPKEKSTAVKTLTDFSASREWLKMAFGLMEGSTLVPIEPDSGQPYSLDEALQDLFLSADQFGEIQNALGRKMNVILEGPPGVGKTFVAKRLAWRLIGFRDNERVQMVQFHQSYAYEDFVQGWRPTESGGFELRNGPFYEFCRQAAGDPDHRYVFIIDEINRANLSKVFGELMMLIEPDKRGPEFAIPLTYSRDGSDTFFVPDNLYVIGLMNTADRSLALVDYALRRRFTFIRLEPAFGTDSFSNFLLEAGAEEDLVDKIVTRMTDLNGRIREDRKNLGQGFEVGHSFFCPQEGDDNLDDAWYASIVRTEIEPLLSEYWFDRSDMVDEMTALLLQ